MGEKSSKKDIAMSFALITISNAISSNRISFDNNIVNLLIFLHTLCLVKWEIFANMISVY